MDDLLSVLGVLAFIPGVIAIAAAVTYIVVKIFPAPQRDEKPAA